MKYLIFNEDTKECSDKDFNTMDEAEKELLLNSKYESGNYVVLPSGFRELNKNKYPSSDMQ